MADFYLQTSFSVNLGEEANTFLIRLVECFTKLASQEIDPKADHDPSDAALKEAIRIDELCGEFGDDVTLEKDNHSGDLVIFGDESCNIDFVLHALQATLKHFQLTDKAIGLEWAQSCSKPRIDAFGGGAAVVTADEIKTLYTNEWIEETKRQLGKS